MPEKSGSAPPSPQQQKQPSNARLDVTWYICLGLLAMFAFQAFFAVRSKSPTYDEPLHAAAAWMALTQGDFRINTEDPLLWKYWAALPDYFVPLNTEFSQKNREAAADDAGLQWPFTVAFLYRTPANVPLLERFFARQRDMMLLVALGLGVVIVWWARKLGGKVAAMTAATLFALDPNFLAHGSLVKNDVALSLVMLALALAVWRAGRKVTVANVAAMTLLCAAAVNTKYSGLLLGPIVAILLLIRALDGATWETFYRRLESRGQKLITAIALIFLCLIVSYAGTWTIYRFRSHSTPDPAKQLNMKTLAVYTAMAELTLKNHGEKPSREQLAAWQPGGMTRVAFYLDYLRVLPQAWVHGLLYTYQSALSRDTFLLDRYSKTGWWYYFPLAMLFKTPLATLAAFAAAVVIAVLVARRLRANFANWTTLCLFIPPAFYLLVAITSNLNLGLRHVLPVYPFLFIGVGLAAAEAWKRWPRATRWVTTVLAVGLAIESFAAFPNYIPFFNVAVGGSRGGLRLLGDSNLDWGQDLKLLAEWQQKHPDERLYLVYFGLADPWAYKIDYTNFPGGYKFGPEVQVSTEPGVLAISATSLQGIYQEGLVRDTFAKLKDLEPIEVLGGSIYLYRWPPKR
jgi:4-amino-4-deoxy-L-arabinose transferase-like glycosyltransferase